jgi:hypothetical protein
VLKLSVSILRYTLGIWAPMLLTLERLIEKRN